jgi:hypothetical protein
LGRLNKCQIDYKSEFAIKVRQTHLRLIQQLEKNTGQKLHRHFENRIKYGNNVAYLSFEGEIGEDKQDFLLWAHSAINGKSPKLEAFNPYFHIYYCMTESNPIIQSGSVNEKNDTLTDNQEVEQDFQGNPIYNRNNDSESKLIERFLHVVGDNSVSGELFIYTTLGPCLSCYRKIVNLIDSSLGDFEDLNVELWYSTDYSDKTI